MKGEISMGPDATQWNGSLCIDKLRDDKNRAVPVKKYLAVAFKSPADVQSEDLQLITNPWMPVQPQVDSVRIDPWTFAVTARWRIEGGYTLSPYDAISININGDLTREMDLVKRSFRVAADRFPGERDVLKP